MHCCFIYVFIIFVFLFIKLLPIIIDLVFTLFYHITLEYDIWFSDCFYPFCFLIFVFQIEKVLQKLPNKTNIRSR